MAAVIVGYARTPFAKYMGALATVPATVLGAHAIRAALERAGVQGDQVDRVLMGQVLQGGAGQGPARQAAVGGGIPLTVPASTLNVVCLSGTEAVAQGAMLIETGRARIVVAGGMESMTLAPHAWPGSRLGHRYGAVEFLDTMDHDGLWDAFEHIAMGASTEAHNADHHVTREDQDAWAAESHRRLEAGAEFLEAEIAPYTITGRKGDTVLSIDDGLRKGTTVDSLSTLAPAFGKGGGITAGNASQITDGRRPSCSPTRRSRRSSASPRPRGSSGRPSSPGPTSRCTRSRPMRSAGRSTRSAAPPTTSPRSRSTRPSPRSPSSPPASSASIRRS